jgi:hypothetical protein
MRVERSWSALQGAAAKRGLRLPLPNRPAIAPGPWVHDLQRVRMSDGVWRYT